MNLTDSPRLAASTRYADIMLVVVAVIWGTSYGVAKQALVFYPVLGFLFIRFTLTFLLLLPALKGNLRKALGPGLPLGLILLGIFVCETYGVAQTGASNAAFLISLCIVFTPFMEFAVFRQRPSLTIICAACISVFGALLLTGGGDVEMNRGDCLMIAAAVLRAVMVCFTRKLTADTDVPALALTAVQTGVVGLGSLLVLLLSPGEIPPLPTDSSFWFATFYLVVFCTLFAFFAQNYALRRTSPSRASLLMGSEPLFGALFAVLWLNEVLSVSAWIGGLMIVLASLWATRPPKEHPVPVQA